MQPNHSPFNSLNRRRWLGTTLAALAGTTLGGRSTPARAETKGRFRDIAPWTLYAFDNGLNGPDVPTIESKVALLKKLGYAGMTDHFNANRLPQVLEQLDRHGLEFASLYCTPKVEDELDPRLREAVALLKGRRARIEIGFMSKQFKPSDPAADARAVDALKRVADWCADTGPLVSIYPHRGFWTERVEDGVRLAQQVGLKTVGTNLNLVHWKWVSQTRPFAQLAAEAVPHLKLVTINGLKAKPSSEASAKQPSFVKPGAINDPVGRPLDAIVSLADGDFDVADWLGTVKKAGYNGPIGLQCYSIKGPSEEHLSRSMEKWRAIQRQLGR